MLFNWVVGFIIPWIFGAYQLKRNPQMVLIIAPFSSCLAFSVNVIGFNLHLWGLYPYNLFTLASIPYDIGFYAVFPVVLIDRIHTANLPPVVFILFGTILTTICEFIGYFMGKVQYYNGWNVGYTFFSYLIPYIIVYNYYLLIRRKGLIK